MPRQFRLCWPLCLILFVGLANATQAQTRLNKVVALMESGKPVFGLFSGEKTPQQAMRVVENELADFVFYSMESGPFDLDRMQVYMQFMLDPRQLGESRSRLNSLPLVLRIPPIRDGEDQARDRSHAALDMGVYGIVFPHVETAEEAKLAIESMRFTGAESGPEGSRPAGGPYGPRYWGVTPEEYRKRADLWPLDPSGELISILLIEDKIGIKNARDIVSTPGASVVIPGPGDLRRAYDGDAEAIEAAIQTVLSACKEFDVVCGITAGPDDIGDRLDQGFRFFIVTSEETLAVGHRAGGR